MPLSSAREISGQSTRAAAVPAKPIRRTLDSIVRIANLHAALTTSGDWVIGWRASELPGSYATTLLPTDTEPEDQPPEDSRTADMVWIPGGTFRMGSNDHYPEEAPVHRVSVDGFWIDRTPVTNRQFKAFIKATATSPRRKSSRTQRITPA